MIAQRIETVRFEAASGGVIPLNWGQRIFWKDAQWLRPDDFVHNLTVEIDVPRQVDTEESLIALASLFSRHQALRTRFTVSPAGEPLQEVSAYGSFPIEVISVSAEQAHHVATDWIKSKRNTRFNFPHDWPVRVALIEISGKPHCILISLSHIIIDGTGALLLRESLKRILSGDLRENGSSSPSHQPIDQSRYENSVDGIRQSNRALDSLERIIRNSPASVFSQPVGTAELPRFARAEMKSEALVHALSLVSRRYKATNSAVLMAATATVLGILTGNESVLLKMVVGNRFRGNLAHMVGVAMGNSLVSISLSGEGFRDVVCRTTELALQAQRHGQFDPFALANRVTRINFERGVYTDLGVLFNDFRRDGGARKGVRVVSGKRLQQLTTKTTVKTTGITAKQNVRFFLDAHTESAVDVLGLIVDTTCIPSAQSEQILLALEALLVAAAGEDLQLSDIAHIVGIVSPIRDCRWNLVDHCWINLDDVRCLLRQVAGCSKVEVFLAGTSDQKKIVAYLESTDSEVNLKEVHQRFVSRLESSPSAMAPSLYVVCSSAPSLPGDQESWFRQPVLNSGSGRGN